MSTRLAKRRKASPRSGKSRRSDAASEGAVVYGGAEVRRYESAEARAWKKVENMKERYTVVVYEKKRIKTVVLYAGRDTFTFKVPASREIRGVVKKQWSIGDTKAYSMRVRAVDVVQLIDAYAHDKARRKIHMLDPVYRAAALQGYKVHDNELYVKLWLEHPLGEPLFHAGDPRERELGDCIKHFTHSYGIWRMVTPPWAADCT